MKKGLASICAALCLALTAGTALAGDIAGKFGVTGRIGFLVPADSDILGYNISTDVGFMGGGGFIYGINRNWAAELDITTTGFEGNYANRSINFDTTNIALGVQYRFKEISKFTPYAGFGLDILVNDADNGLNVDTVVGVHLSGGVDYFILKNVALTSEMKFVLAPTADISRSGNIGNFDPSCFSMTFGARYFFN